VGFFTQEFDGQLTLERLPDDFAARIQHRVEDGLFVPGQRRRANYRVTSMDRDTVTFVAEGLMTTYNIGLNEVTMRRSGRNQIAYHVSYAGWTRIAVGHGALIGIAFLLGYILIPALRSSVAAYPSGAVLCGVIVAFFSLAWPWILTAFHRRFAERALQNILSATLSGPPARSGAEAPDAERRHAS
jgi:hypothetical protein